MTAGVTPGVVFLVFDRANQTDSDSDLEDDFDVPQNTGHRGRGKVVLPIMRIVDYLTYD